METTDEPFIYPAVKRAVAWLAGLAAVLALAAAVLSLLCIAGFCLGLPGFALLCGTASQLMSRLLIVALGLLVPWCHHVLLAGRGGDISRWLAGFGVFLALLVLACSAYSAFVPELLLPRQDDVVLMLLVLMLSIAAFNLPRMAAASAGRRAAIVLAPLLLLLVELTDIPPLLLPAAALKLMAAALLFPQLRRLRQVAPLIVSMPERDAFPPPPRDEQP